MKPAPSEVFVPASNIKNVRLSIRMSSKLFVWPRQRMYHLAHIFTILTDCILETFQQERPFGTVVVDPSKPKITLDDVPYLVDQILNAEGEASVVAVKHVYELCDVAHKKNRFPMVCSGMYDVLSPLAECLNKESADSRHLACLALNNLSVPIENKTVMALGPASTKIIGGLCKLIAEQKLECYLSCICLMNLAFLEDTITAMLQYSPSDGHEVAPLDNPKSLLRVLEKLLISSCSHGNKVKPSSNNTVSLLRRFDKLSTSFASVAAKTTTEKFEAVRWACGLLRNLSKNELNATLIGQTEIPTCVVHHIRSSRIPPSQWTRNSLEHFSLEIIFNLALWPVSRATLVTSGARQVIQPITFKGDWQGKMASMAYTNLGATSGMEIATKIC